jgi:hypothetical protein
MQADGYLTLSPKRIRLLFYLSFAVTTIVGVVSLWTPFLIDQSIFVYGGKTIASGDVLYRDYWDIKPPGIFFFYALAGQLFSFTEPGIHLLELLWQLAGALALTWIARQCVANPGTAAMVPLATVGVYYALASSWHMTQVEALVGPPLAAALAAVYLMSQRPNAASGSLLLGASTAVVGALKVVYLAIPAGFAVILAVELARRRDLSRSLAVRMIGFALLGLALVWLPILGYFAYHGALSELVWTTFGYPAEALKEVPMPAGARLRSSFGWTLDAYLPFSPLILLGLATLHRPRRPVVGYGVLFYLLAGIVLIIAQRTSWWEYHQTLLFAPLGLLATLGLDHLVSALRSARRRRYLIAAAAITLTALPLLTLLKHSFGTVVSLRSALETDSEAGLSIRLDPTYQEMWEKTGFVRATGSRPGTVYVFGDQRYLLLANRPQAIAVHGHAWLHLPERMWQRLPSELMAAKPAYVFLSGANKKLLEERSPELLRHIQTRYRPERRAPTGRWLIRTGSTNETDKQSTRRRRRKPPKRTAVDDGQRRKTSRR